MKNLLAVIFLNALCVISLHGQNLFEDPSIISSNVEGAIDVVGDDYDLDGDIDLVAAAFDEDQILYFENLGGGNFASEQILGGEIDGPRRLASSDIDGDGDADILGVSSFDNKVFYYENLGDGSFGDQVSISSDFLSPTGISVNDLDGDNDPEVICSSWDGNKISYFDNLGDGNFSTEVIITTDTYQAAYVTSEDMDGDGDFDVLVAYTSDIVYYKNQGNGNFDEEPVIINPSISSPRHVDVIDLDGDGDLDVMSASELSDLIAYYENLGNETFSAINSLTFTANFAETVLASDIDHDGDPDILFASKFDNKIGYFENLGELSFTAEILISSEMDFPHALFAADMNGDGLTDLVSASKQDHSIALFEAKGGLTKVSGRIYEDKNDNGVYDTGDEGIKTSLLIEESGEIFNSHEGGLYSMLIQSFVGKRTLHVSLPSILQCDQSEFINFSYSNPTNGSVEFEGEADSEVNQDFILNKIELNECTQSSGYVYLDLNENGIKDPAEQGIPGVTLYAKITDQFAYSDGDGFYKFNFSTSIEEAIVYVEHYLVSCDGYYENSSPPAGESIIIQTSGDNTDLNFGLVNKEIPAGLPCYDHAIASLCAYRGVHPGNTFKVWVDTKTFGENINESELRLNFDPAHTLLNANWEPDEIGVDYLLWKFPPKEAPIRYCFELRWELDATVMPGDVLEWEAHYTSKDYLEPSPFNNSKYHETEVFERSRSNGNVELFSEYANGPMTENLDSSNIELSYVILFENNSLDTLSELTIIDTLPPELEVRSVTKPFSGHPHEFSIQNSNILIWQFKNLDLPNKKDDPGGYYGFTQFNVQLKEGISLGSSFSNKATVIFNNGMIESSNEITHKYDDPNGIAALSIETDELIISPNPANSKFTLELSNERTVQLELNIINSVGKLMYHSDELSSASEISTEDWPAGVYLVHLRETGSERRVVRKLVVN